MPRHVQRAPAAPPSRAMNCRRLMRAPLRLRRTLLGPTGPKLISVALRVLLQFLELFLGNGWTTESVRERHVLHGEREQCCCDAGGRASNSDFRSPISH